MSIFRPPLFDLLDTNGDGTGDRNAILDYSVTPGIFKIGPPSNEQLIWYIHKIQIFIAGTGAFSGDKYGDLPALTNGIEIRIFNTNAVETVFKFNSAEPDNNIRTNNDLLTISQSGVYNPFSGASKGFCAILDFGDNERALKLDPKLGEELQFVLNDDFSGLQMHTFLIQGRKDRR